VFIAAPDGESGERARQMIEALTKEIAVGEVYTGRVTRLMSRGAFVEILPGKEGLVELRELTDRRISRPDEVVKVGDVLRVRVKEIDGLGRINLSARGLEQTLETLKGGAPAQTQGARPSHPPRPAPPRPQREPERPKPEPTEELPKPQFRPKR
jgi:polyribonucleotide nucleotidyltransferase